MGGKVSNCPCSTIVLRLPPSMLSDKVGMTIVHEAETGMHGIGDSTKDGILP